MAFIHLYPYTDFHELNLDWVLRQIEKIQSAVGVTFDNEKSGLTADNVQDAIDEVVEIIDEVSQQSQKLAVIENDIPESYWNDGHVFSHLQTVNNPTCKAIIEALREDKVVILKRTRQDGVSTYYDFFIQEEIEHIPADYQHVLTMTNFFKFEKCACIINGLADDQNVFVELLPDAVGTLVTSFNTRTGAVVPEEHDYTAEQVDFNGSLSGLSDNVQDAIDEVVGLIGQKQDELVFDNTPTEDSQNPVTSEGIKNALDLKQDELVFDNTPTLGSQNPVTSDGIRQAITASVAGVASFNTRTGAVVAEDHDYDADQVDYDNSNSGLSATNVQDAIDEIAGSGSVSVTLTINGAKEDTITIKDSDNVTVGTCIFASDQTSGTATIDVPVGGGSYKFISSVAKDTTSGTSDYEKIVTLSDNPSQTVNVYPEKALYWYGNYFITLTTNNGTITDGVNQFEMVKTINSNPQTVTSTEEVNFSGVTVKAFANVSTGNTVNVGYGTSGSSGYEGAFFNVTSVPFDIVSGVSGVTNKYLQMKLNGNSASARFKALWLE